jgi:hypothetical protein
MWELTDYNAIVGSVWIDEYDIEKLEEHTETTFYLPGGQQCDRTQASHEFLRQAVRLLNNETDFRVQAVN